MVHFKSSKRVTHRTTPRSTGHQARLAGFVLGIALALGPQALDRSRMLQAAQRLGARALAALPALDAMLQEGTGADEEAQLALVKAFFNRRIVFRDDAQVWGQADHWTSPLELLDKGEGDCEDYVIAKYFSLLALGMPVRRLRLVYVRAEVGGRSVAHMVLAYYAQSGEEPMILDNLVTSVRPASRRPDLTPVFSFNSEGLWTGIGSQSAGDPQVRLSRWTEVLARARAEGFV